MILVRLFLHKKLVFDLKNTLIVSVANPDPGSGAFLTPGSGMGRKSASRSGMNNPDHIFKSLETIFSFFFGLKYLNSLMPIRDGDSSDPGWKKVGSGIRDKHPGSATLLIVDNGGATIVNNKS